MNSFRDLFPAFDLSLAVDAWDVGITARLDRDEGSLSDEECPWFGGSLGVIILDKGNVWDMVCVCTETAKRGHGDAMLKFMRAH